MASSIFGNSGMAQSPVNSIQQIRTMMQIARGSANPNQTAQYLLSQNPQYNTVINYVRNNGGDPQKAFYQMAKEKGVDPNAILSALK